MTEFQYDKAGFNYAQAASVLFLTSVSQLRPTLGAFVVNLRRIDGLLSLMPYFVDATMNNTLLTAHVMQNVMGHTGLYPTEPLTTEQEERIERVFQEEVRKHVLRTANEDVLDRGLSRMNQLLTVSPPAIGIGIETLFTSQILIAWTAIESLLKDMWEVSLNTGPIEWVEKTMTKSDFKKEQQGKSINADDLHRFHFDIRGKMGTLLKDKIKMGTLDEILSAYHPLVGPERINECDQYLDGSKALEAVRHSLTHKGGIVDEIFLRKTASLPAFQKAKLGAKIVITGEMSGLMTANGVSLAMTVIKAVNDGFVKFNAETEAKKEADRKRADVAREIEMEGQ